MAAPHLEFLVEEPSLEAFLQELLPSHLPAGITFQIHAHRGKGDLLTKLAGRLRGYARWPGNNWRIFVLVDRDADDCQKLKQRLEDMSAQVGLRTRTRAAGGNSWQVANRIVIEELEAWYFGDPEAICSAYPRVSLRALNQARYRDPDAISDTWETLKQVLRRKGYFRRGISKPEAARNIAAHIAPQRNRSRSFKVFYAAVLEAVGP